MDGITRYSCLDQLQEGQKVTLVCSSSFGGIFAYQTTWVKYETSPHYQKAPADMDTAILYHKPRRARSVYRTAIEYLAPLAVYAGWVEIDTEALAYETIEVTPIMTTRRSRYTSMDSRLFDDLLAAYPNPLVFIAGAQFHGKAD